MELCIAGKNNIAVDCLIYSINVLNIKKICVVVNENDLYKNTWQKSLGFYAKLFKIPILSIDEVQNYKNITFISLEYDKIIDPRKFNTTKLYNIHFSYLPEYKGMFTSLLPILHGKKYSGVTLHYIDQGIDTGRIIAQKKLNIRNFNCSDLYNEYIREGTEIVCKNLPKLLNGNCKSKKQNINESTYFSKSSFNFNDIQINPNKTAFQISNFVKALNFRIYQLPEFANFKINRTQILPINSNKKPGTIISEDDKSIEISTIDYNIKLYKDYYETLIDCCITDNDEKARLIIDKIIDINEKNRNGWNPLIIACFNGASNMVKLLLANNANPFVTNLNGTTTLMYAKEAYLNNNNKKDIICQLLAKGLDPLAQDIWGKTIFDYTDNFELIKILKTNFYD